MRFINRFSWLPLIMVCLTLGLAPFNPPHLIEKLNMLVAGTLSQPVDWFDLLMHATPWLLLMLKLIVRASELVKNNK